MKVFALVFDLTRPESLESLRLWHDEIIKANPKARGIIVGTKLDLVQDRKVTGAAIDAITGELGCKAFLVSAKTGENCKGMIEELAHMVVQSETSAPKT